MNTLPSALLVRFTTIRGGEAMGSLTLDSHADIKATRELRNNVRSIVEPLIAMHQLRIAPDAEIEILTGRTANRIDRLETLLNDCRNLLADIDGLVAPHLQERIDAMFDAIDPEVGL